MSSHVIAPRAERTRARGFRPIYSVPLVLFTASIVGGLAVLAAELPVTSPF